MEQVLAPRFDFTPKDAGPKEGFDYGPDGYVGGRTNVGWNEERGHFREAPGRQGQEIDWRGLERPRGDLRARLRYGGNDREEEDVESHVEED